MSSEIRLAFAHPSERAEAMADEPRDRISLRDHIREVEIGAFQAERGATQRICFNIVVEVRLPDGLNDDVDRILSYDTITEAIDRELNAERLNLLETLADRVAEGILADPRAARVFVRIEKLDRGPGALGVEIVREREAVTPIEPEPVCPRVLLLEEASIHAPDLSSWLDRLSEGEAPLILCVGQAERSRPLTEHAFTQRRIDLLALEQQAWVLASRDPRCVVVATRTELDWAMKQNQISVWAPSKIVLDATEKPDLSAVDGMALAEWFAQEFSAVDVSALQSDGRTVPLPDAK
ncbi:MAG: dihydroneopterin aldolase [Pseudomonadota bacterium]